MPEDDNVFRRFTLMVEYEVDLSVEEVWPDGDAPESPTTAGVAEKMRKQGHTPTSLLSDWMIEPQHSDVCIAGPGGPVDPWSPRQNAEIARFNAAAVKAPKPE